MFSSDTKEHSAAIGSQKQASHAAFASCASVRCDARRVLFFDASFSTLRCCSQLPSGLECKRLPQSWRVAIMRTDADLTVSLQLAGRASDIFIATRTCCSGPAAQARIAPSALQHKRRTSSTETHVCDAVPVLVVDFDDTLTQGDTIGILIDAAITAQARDVSDPDDHRERVAGLQVRGTDQFAASQHSQAA